MRAEADARPTGPCCIEAEIAPAGRNRVQVNRQPLRRARDLLGALRVTVFSPDDLALVKGGPGERRRYLDDTLVAVHPRNDALRRDVDRILKQRNALLKQAGGRLDPEVELPRSTCGTPSSAPPARPGRGPRRRWSPTCCPTLQQAYDEVADEPSRVVARYEPAWLADAVASPPRWPPAAPTTCGAG